MECIEGDRGGLLWVKDNFIYKCNSKNNGVRYLVCKTDRCGIRAFFREGEADWIVVGNHNHPADNLQVEVLRFKLELRRLSVTDVRAPRDIFDDVSRRYPRAAEFVTFSNMRTTMYRCRTQGHSPVPNSVQQFCEILQMLQWVALGTVMDPENPPSAFFRGLIGPGGEPQGWTSAVFMSDRMLERLGPTRRLHFDATFKVLPNELHAYQLLTVHAEYLDTLFPVAFVIMTRKTQQAYEGTFRYISQIATQWAPDIIMTDFEVAMRNAARLVWPAASIVGCFFHYAQAVHRKHVALQLQPMVEANLELKKAFHMLLALSLLPAERIATGLEVVRHYVATHGHLHTFTPMLMYMENHWMLSVGPNSFSVFGQSHRTNNAVEGFYSQLVRRVGPRPGVWKFNDELRKIEFSKWQDLNRMMNGLHVVSVRREYRRQDTAIRSASDQLARGAYNEAQFLDRMSHCSRGLLIRLGAQRAVPGERPAVPVMPPQVAAVPHVPQPPQQAVPEPIPRPRLVLHVPGQEPMALRIVRPIRLPARGVPQANEPRPLDEPVVARVGEPPVRQRMCVVCLEHAVTHILTPCGHLCMCETCVNIHAQHLEVHRCPTCRQVVQGTFRVFYV